MCAGRAALSNRGNPRWVGHHTEGLNPEKGSILSGEFTKGTFLWVDLFSENVRANLPLTKPYVQADSRSP